jgi:hypothetical protein
VRHLTAGEKPAHETTGRWAAIAIIAGAGAFGLAGCSSTTSAGATGTTCGATRTAAGVAVTIQVAKGPADCAAALRAEAAYATAIRNGDLRGNGGGSPVTVDGWTCESYPTTEALRTRDASECHTAKAEVVAVLSASATSSAVAGPTGS